MACYIPLTCRSGGDTFPMSPPNSPNSDTSRILRIDRSAVAIPDRNCCRMQAFKGSFSCHKVKQQTSLMQWSIIKLGFWKCNTIETKHSASAAFPNKQASLPMSWACATKQFKRYEQVNNCSYSKRIAELTYQTMCVPRLRLSFLSFSENSLFRSAEFGLYAWWPNCHKMRSERVVNLIAR